MTTQLTTGGDDALVLSQARPLDQNPAAVYLARLSPVSRRTMRHALDSIAGLASGGQVDALALEWAALRFQHTVAIRAKLAELYAPTTVNKMLSALRGVLQAGWPLGPWPSAALLCCPAAGQPNVALPRSAWHASAAWLATVSDWQRHWLGYVSWPLPVLHLNMLH